MEEANKCSLASQARIIEDQEIYFSAAETRLSHLNGMLELYVHSWV